MFNSRGVRFGREGNPPLRHSTCEAEHATRENTGCQPGVGRAYRDAVFRSMTCGIVAVLLVLRSTPMPYG
jgi:hypothetical protein